MSKVELVRCDACGLVQGEDGRGPDTWAEVLPPSDLIGGFSIGLRMASKRHYCLNCWSVIEKSIPSLPQRPAAPIKGAKK